MIPVSDVAKRWLKAPSFRKAYEALEREFSAERFRITRYDPSGPKRSPKFVRTLRSQQGRLK